MKKRPYIFAAISVVLIIGIIVMISNCSGGSRCDKKQCKSYFGLSAKQKPSQRDSIFKISHPLQATKFNVYIENSCSMDGYVNGNTVFKTCMHRLIGQVKADVLDNDSNVSLNYINSDSIIRQKCPTNKFAEKMTHASFSSAGGDRANSKIIDIIDNVVKNTRNGEVSMFVSDCVYSPESADDIHKALAKQQTDMLNILKNKAKSDSTFGVLIYRLISDFDGIYYTKTNEPIQYKGDRPYFVWFMGDASIIANVAKCVNSILKDYSEKNELQSIVGIPPYSYIPYETNGSNHAYHYIDKKTNKDSYAKISFLADMAYLPLDAKYIENKSNYKCEGKSYSIKDIEKYSGDEKNKYNYKYTVRIKGDKYSLVPQTSMEISLMSSLKNLPKWVDEYNDPKGEPIHNGYMKTFGIKSLIDGIAEFYDSPYYVTFKIKVN